MLTLPDLLRAHPILLGDYLARSRQLGVLLLDASGRICDCNAYFEELLAAEDSPVGKPLQDFLSEAFPWEALPPAPGWTPVRIPFRIRQAEHLCAAQMVSIGDARLLIAHAFRANQQQALETLSRLTDELTDLTRELHRKNRELSIANERITELMNVDPLTGLANRRAFKELVDRELSSARRHRLDLSALMVDIDHFKAINDDYGHDVGDLVLVAVGRALLGAARREDIVARLGGEEFVVILHASSLEDALLCAERMRRNIEILAFPGIDRPVTASFGATTFRPAEAIEDLLKRADAALYDAKRSGRNRVVSR